jgi:DNA polymerase V
MERKPTGFASPAQGYEDETIDLNRLLIHNPPATYFVRLDSSDMTALGLPRGSLLVIDRSKSPLLNNLVLIRHEGQFLCRLMTRHNGLTVFTDTVNDITPVIDDTEIIGVVTASIQEYGSGFSH